MYNFYLNIIILVLTVVLWFLVVKSRKKGHGETGFFRKIYIKDLDEVFAFIAWALLVINLIYFFINISSFYIVNKFIATYPETKAFLERDSGNTFESFSFREKKYEINEDLIAYQWLFEEMPSWTFVTQEIMQYEPIE